VGFEPHAINKNAALISPVVCARWLFFQKALGMDWIHRWIRLDWVGFSGTFVDWIRLARVG